MDAQGRITVAAWAATLAAAMAMLPLVNGTGWVLQAAFLLAVQGGVGALARWRNLSGPLTVALQVVGSLLLLTLLTVPEHAVAGVLPGRAAFEALGLLLASGVDDVSRHVAPAPLTDGIRLMLVGGVVLIGLVVDVLAATLRSAAPAGLPLLALYSVAAGVAQEDARWPYFLCAAAGYLLLLLAEGRNRLTQWGRFFTGQGGGRQASPRDQELSATPRVRTGRRIGVVTLGVAVLAPALLPSLGGGLLDLSDGGRNGRGGLHQISSVNPVVALQDQLNRPADQTVLTYRSTIETPSEMYLRLVALDRFDGNEWSSAPWNSDGITVPEPPWIVTGLSPEVRTTTVSTLIEAEDTYVQSSLPVPYPAVRIEAGGGWLYSLGSQTLVSKRPDLTVQGLSYEVEHLLLEPSARQLAAAPNPRDPELQAYFTHVPDELPTEVRETALEVTAGAENHHERAVALQDWFTESGGFRYDTEVSAGTGAEAIVGFLDQREGFCVHFAFTMAAMARTLDIPAQVAVGFTPGEQQPDGSYQVGLHNAHAWPELYFEGVGWTRFEPTPGQGSAPSHTSPESNRPDPDTSAEPEREQPDAPAEEENTSADPDRCDPRLEPGACQDDQTGAAGATDMPTPNWLVLWGVGGGLLLAVLALLPTLWRTRARARRLKPGAGPLAAWRELTDTAWDHGITPRATETPRQTAHRIVRACELTGPSAAAVHQVATAVERQLYASAGRGTGADTDSGLADAVRTACAGSRMAVGRLARLRARLLPRSANRVRRELTERRQRTGHQVGETLHRASSALRPRRQRT